MKNIINIFCILFVLNSPAQNFTNRQVYDFEPGDVFQTKYGDYTFPPLYTYVKDSVIFKYSSFDSDTLFYNLLTEVYQPYRGPELPPLDTIYSRTIFYTLLDSSAKHFIFNSCFPPTDTFFQSEYYCYRNVWGLHSNGFESDSCFEAPSFYSELIEGCGGPYYSYNEGSTPNVYSLKLIYYKKFNDTCGSLITSLSTNILPHKISIYPNPSQGYIYFMDNMVRTQFEIFDATGRKVQVGILESNFLNISELENGIYFIKIFDRQNTYLKLSFPLDKK